MLPALLWLSPASSDLLRSTSQLLRGKVPCPAGQLAGLLRKAAVEDCSGLLRDEGIRSRLAARLDAAGKEVSDAGAASLVDDLAAVLQEDIEEIRKQAATVSKTLAKNGAAWPSYQDAVAALPKGMEPSESLRKDWLLWHAVGGKQQAKELPPPAKEIICERIAFLASKAAAGPVADCAVALHVLENLEEYIKWESSLPANKTQTKSKAVLQPFNEKMSREACVRRILASAVSPAVATTAATAAGKGGLQKLLQELAEKARKDAVIPLYVAPVSAEPKAKKEKEGAQEQKGKEQKGKEAKGSAPGEGDFGALRGDLASQELQWNLLAYRLRPGTALSAATSMASKAAGASAGVSRGLAPVGSTGSSCGPPLTGFAAVWAGSSTKLPPGHTPFSWLHEKAQGMAEGFPCTWSPAAPQRPPGHTDYSWEGAAFASGGTAGSSAPSKGKAEAKAEAKAKAKAAAAPAKGGKATAPAASASAASGTAPPDGSVEAALCKLDFRCGRIKEVSKVPDSDKLYLVQVDIGSEEPPRQVVTGLQKHYKLEEMQNRRVLVYCNIKPGKMLGYESQAMILAAVANGHTEQEICELLQPPPDAKEGTRAMCGPLEAGSLSATQNVKNISKVWNQVKPLLSTNDKCEATFNGVVLTMGDAAIKSSKLAGVPIS
mmetsp:Transcript_59059/g.127772  ORF Transcript_59059/g.127772 Transcript_59059/m.127772 type:complete len:661 (-) Transcript_59059:91-2073(-)